VKKPPFGKRGLKRHKPFFVAPEAAKGYWRNKYLITEAVMLGGAPRPPGFYHSGRFITAGEASKAAREWQAKQLKKDATAAKAVTYVGPEYVEG